MREWKFGWMTILLTLVLAVSIMFTGCTGSDDDDDDDEEHDDDVIISIDGYEYNLSDMFDTFTKVTITGSDQTEYTGISLSDVVNSSNVAGPEQYQFMISANDGYAKNVTWADMLRGVMVEDGTMTAFPDLPGKYRIRDVVSMNPADVETLVVNGRLYVAKQPFDIFAFELVEETVDNDTYEGVRPSDLLNHSGLLNGSANDFTIYGSDGYNKTVNWTMMMDGVLVEADMQIVFPELATSFWVSDIVTIEVI